MPVLAARRVLAQDPLVLLLGDHVAEVEDETSLAFAAADGNGVHRHTGLGQRRQRLVERLVERLLAVREENRLQVFAAGLHEVQRRVQGGGEARSAAAVEGMEAGRAQRLFDGRRIGGHRQLQCRHAAEDDQGEA